MKQNQFGHDIIDSDEDDLGGCLGAKGLEPSSVYATISPEGDDAWGFDIQAGEGGIHNISSLGIFESEQAVRSYLEKHGLDPDEIEVLD
ncbi:MAG: hypothetical protein ACTS10_21850 [Kiloniellales bacterium]